MKYFKQLSFLLTFQLPLQTLIGYVIGFNYFSPLICFLLVPLLDLMLGKDQNNSTMAEQALFFKALTLLWVPLQLAILIFGGYVVSHESLSPGQLIAFVFSIALLTGAGVTIAHELGHRRGWLEPLLAKLLLSSVCYTHFLIEHNQGHHQHVGTPQDAASARFQESFYAFYLRSVTGTYRNAWRIEQSRLIRRGFPFWSFHNQMLNFHCFSLLWMLSFQVSFGWTGLLYFCIQSFIAFSFLEATNYVEHYGLQRKEITPGKYEKVSIQHSWNANHFLTNRYLLHLERHSDHHLHPNRRYQALQHHEDSPQLPNGYAGMVPLALIPPLWFKVMNPRVLKWQQRGDL
ncbi:MAG: alkane 1-monooxygenase [SAR324 cluster bacterium]|uniref:Alkane 1-monooxygenase n=1 Tax=SAR324 cluster bacterium TaxID=2024889 RepID=A0A2A4T4K8_9DELT|nr:MAG: alkane 1-monooxygenase [SAR324 cluster bacterium]